MNKNIFLTLAAALIAGAVLYKMPSRAAEDVAPQAKLETPAQQIDLGAAVPQEQQIRQDASQQAQTKPTIDEQSAMREKEKNLARPEVKISVEDLATIESGKVDGIYYIGPKLGFTRTWDTTWPEIWPILEEEKLKLYTILLGEDIQYLKKKIRMQEEKIAALEAVVNSKE